MGIGEKWRFLSDKWKYAIGIGIVVCMIAVVYCGNIYAKNKLQKQISASSVTEKSDRMGELVKINQKMPLFFDEKDSNFLAERVTEEQVTALEKEVEQVTQSNTSQVTEVGNTEYEKEVAKAQEGIQRIKTTYETKKAINSLYKNDQETSAIKGSTVNKDLPIADDLKKDAFQKTKISYFKTDETQVYDKTINELLTNAENQLTQIEKAKTEIEKIYKDNKVVSTDRALYDAAKAETDKIKNEKIKKTFSDQLEKVKKEMDAKGNETAESTEQSVTTEQDPSIDSANDSNLYQNPADGGQGNDYGYNDNGYTPNGNNSGGTGVTPTPDNNNGNSNGGNDSGQTGNIDGDGQGEIPPENPSDGGNDNGNGEEQPTDNTID
ncbi:hypothetical protein ACYSNW_10770 [Enterococcus sp. LJL99]